MMGHGYYDMRLTHLPTGIMVQASRYSRSQNHTLSVLMKLLRSKIYWLEKKPDMNREVRVYTDEKLFMDESEKILMEANLKRLKEIR